MIRRPPRSTLFPYTTPSDLQFLLLRVHGDGRLLLALAAAPRSGRAVPLPDRKSTRLNSSHVRISYAVFCLKKKNTQDRLPWRTPITWQQPSRSATDAVEEDT